MIPVHDATLRFLRHPVLYQCCDNGVLMGENLPVRHRRRFIFHIAPFIPLVGICGQRHVQLHGGRLRLNDAEAIVTDNQRQRSAVIPLHMHVTNIIDALDGTHGTGGNRIVRVIHCIQLDARACRILLAVIFDFSSGHTLEHFTFLPLSCPAGRWFPAIREQGLCCHESTF